MNSTIKIKIFFVLTIIIVSCIYFSIFIVEKPLENEIQNNNEDTIGDSEEENRDNKDENNQNNNMINNIIQYSFIEEGTAGSCVNCPEVAKVIHKLYEKEESRFYYISLIQDENKKAESRLLDEYNVYGYPTVYIDGGYEVILGAKDNFKTVFEEKLNKALNRKKPNLYLTIESEWNETREELTNKVNIENWDDTKYIGKLKIYITEKRSRWNDHDKEPYAFGFLDYGYNDDIVINANDKISIEEKWNPKNNDFTEVYPENLWIVAAVFSSEKNTGYSNPDKDEYKFDAHYVDSVNATNISEGKLPPSIGIISPQIFYRYIGGNEFGKTLFGKTIIIGNLPITVKIIAEEGVEKVDYTIKGKHKTITETVTKAPYSYTWDSIAFGKYLISVKVTDNEGRIATDDIEVFALILGLS